MQAGDSESGATVVYEKSLASVGFGMIMLIIADFITMTMKNRWKYMIYLPVNDVSQSSQALRKSKYMQEDGLTTTELQV